MILLYFWPFWAILGPPHELYCTPVMFAGFICALLSFCACKFPAKPETQEPGKIIKECTYYLYMWLNFILLHHLIDWQQTAYPPPQIQSCNIFTCFGRVCVPLVLIAQVKFFILDPRQTITFYLIYIIVYTRFILCVLLPYHPISECARKRGRWLIDWLVSFFSDGSGYTKFSKMVTY